MWTTKHTATTPLAAARVWAALRDVHTGACSSPGGDVFEIHGPFAVGTELSVTPQGQETVRSRITELADGERYADRTEYGGLVLIFRHTLCSVPGGTEVTHELVIDGPDADAAGPELGAQISADFPAAMQGLFDLAADTTDARTADARTADAW